MIVDLKTLKGKREFLNPGKLWQMHLIPTLRSEALVNPVSAYPPQDLYRWY
jgi:hypothetical protein